MGRPFLIKCTNKVVIVVIITNPSRKRNSVSKIALSTGGIGWLFVRPFCSRFRLRETLHDESENSNLNDLAFISGSFFATL